MPAVLSVSSVVPRGTNNTVPVYSFRATTVRQITAILFLIPKTCHVIVFDNEGTTPDKPLKGFPIGDTHEFAFGASLADASSIVVIIVDKHVPINDDVKKNSYPIINNLGPTSLAAEYEGMAGFSITAVSAEGKTPITKEEIRLHAASATNFEIAKAGVLADALSKDGQIRTQYGASTPDARFQLDGAAFAFVGHPDHPLLQIDPSMYTSFETLQWYIPSLTRAEFDGDQKWKNLLGLVLSLYTFPGGFISLADAAKLPPDQQVIVAKEGVSKNLKLLVPEMEEICNSLEKETDPAKKAEVFERFKDAVARVLPHLAKWTKFWTPETIPKLFTPLTSVCLTPGGPFVAGKEGAPEAEFIEIAKGVLTRGEMKFADASGNEINFLRALGIAGRSELSAETNEHIRGLLACAAAPDADLGKITADMTNPVVDVRHWHTKSERSWNHKLRETVVRVLSALQWNTDFILLNGVLTEISQLKEHTTHDEGISTLLMALLANTSEINAPLKDDVHVVEDSVPTDELRDAVALFLDEKGFDSTIVSVDGAETPLINIASTHALLCILSYVSHQKKEVAHSTLPSI